MSQIRLWRLDASAGPDAFDMLKRKLMTWQDVGGDLDLIWDEKLSLDVFDVTGDTDCIMLNCMSDN